MMANAVCGYYLQNHRNALADAEACAAIALCRHSPVYFVSIRSLPLQEPILFPFPELPRSHAPHVLKEAGKSCWLREVESVADLRYRQ